MSSVRGELRLSRVRALIGVGVVLRKSWEWESPLPGREGVRSGREALKGGGICARSGRTSRLLSDGEVMGRVVQRGRGGREQEGGALGGGAGGVEGKGWAM